MLLKKNIPFSYIFKKLRIELLDMLIGLVIYYLTSTFRNIIPEILMGIPAFLGITISLVLSFKLYQSTTGGERRSIFPPQKNGNPYEEPLQQPPTNTPMNAIGNTIEINIRQLLGETQVSKPMSSNTFYML